MARSGRFCYTLDVLTDGSEHTGCGTLFLSVWRIPLSVQKAAASFAADDESESESENSGSSSVSSQEESSDGEDNVDAAPVNSIDSDSNSNEIPDQPKISDPYAWLTGDSESNFDQVPIARYAISGLGDATARLCADQRFKLAPTKACFLPQVGRKSKAVDGLSALFLALYGEGAPSLHMVLPKTPVELYRDNGQRKAVDDKTDESFVEEIATVVLGKHKNMDIRTCEIPQADKYSDGLTWWKVYEDDHLIAHASCSSALTMRDTEEQHEKSSSLVYLYSFPASQLGCNKRTSSHNPYCTIALLPPQCRNITDVTERLMKQNRPMIRDGVPMTCIDYVLFLDPMQPVSSENHSQSTQILMTAPRQYDEGILIRSQQIHRHFYRAMPNAFVPPLQSLGTTEDSNGLILRSGTSIVLEKNNNKITNHEMPTERIWNRQKSIWKKEIKEEWTHDTIDSLKSFATRSCTKSESTTPVDVSDDNEIDLEDETDSEKEEEVGDVSSGHGPRLVVLGTGCATPSAYRGSSGYALILPSRKGANQTYCHSINESSRNGNSGLKDVHPASQGEEIYILDCGEGVSTMLSRNCGTMKDWRRQIRGIWISHAHLDHYGGLPTLLRLLCEERESASWNTEAQSTAEPTSKRPRHSRNQSTTIPVPWVIAPPKVLHYLDIILDCKYGRSRNGNVVCFEPRSHFIPSLPPASPFFHFENLKVYHNCCPAFGLLVGFMGKSNTRRFLCFSGDTRPSQNLVRACRRVFARGKQASRVDDSRCDMTQPNLFLIHEATYRDTERHMAEKKKHSTLREAWEVANDIPNCSRVLMTHFSQRYDNVLEEDSPLNFNENGPSVGLAVDGLWIDLN